MRRGRKVSFQAVSAEQMEAVRSRLARGGKKYQAQVQARSSDPPSITEAEELEFPETSLSRSTSPVTTIHVRPASTLEDDAPGIDSEISVRSPDEDSKRAEAKIRLRQRLQRLGDTGLSVAEAMRNNKQLFRTSYMERFRDHYHFLPGTRTPSRKGSLAAI